MRIAIINGPNLNLTGKREPDVYGSTSFDDFLKELNKERGDIEIEYFQSNIEGELINKVQEFGYTLDGIVINPGGYAHTSVALADAISAVPAGVAEVHMSNIYAREEYRHVLLTGAKCDMVISGAGLMGYYLAILYLTKNQCKKQEKTR